MNSDTRNRRKRRLNAPQSTTDLLCLLAAYEAYGIGLAWSDCLRELAARDARR